MTSENAMSLKIGDTIYEFEPRSNSNRKEPHTACWKPVVIMGETTRSWLIHEDIFQKKVAKKDLEAGSLNHFKKTWKEVEEVAYCVDHGYFIANCVSGVKDDYQKIKAIADLIGYNTETKNCKP